MSTTLSKKMGELRLSPTSALFEKVADMKRNGIEVLSLCVGEPDAKTPEHIKEAGIDAIHNDMTRYTPGSGMHECKLAVQEKLQRDNHLSYELDEITISVGAKQGITSAIMAVAGEGDEVIIPVPCYVSYPDMVKLAGATPVFVKKKDDFHLDVEAIRAAVTEHTKALILCTPNNPTAVVYQQEELAEVAKLAKEKDFFVISDEIYENLVYGGKKHMSIASFAEIKDRVILVNGVSKSYSMTGWRVGYVCGRKDVIAAIVKVQSQITTCVSGISQKAAVAALTGPQEVVTEMVANFEKRRNFVMAQVDTIPGLFCNEIEGAFYAFLDVRKFLGKSVDGKVIADDTALCNYFLEEYQLALMPGSAYFLDGFIRISFATSMLELQTAFTRMKEGFSRFEGVDYE